MHTALQVAILVAATALQGCSTCFTKSMVNVRPVGGPGDFELEETQPYVTRLLVPDLLDVRIGLCTPISEQHVCLHLRVAPGQTAVLTESAFGTLSTGRPQDLTPFPPQQYQVLCESRGGSTMKCPTPPEVAGSQLAPAVLIYSGGHKDWRFERWAHTVQAATSFRGAPGDPDPPAWKLLSKYSSWHEYRLQLAPASSFTESETVLQLPSITVSGKSYAFPPLSVRVAPTNVCPVYA
jgi:hypothetical protein